MFRQLNWRHWHVRIYCSCGLLRYVTYSSVYENRMQFLYWQWCVLLLPVSGGECLRLFVDVEKGNCVSNFRWCFKWFPRERCTWHTSLMYSLLRLTWLSLDPTGCKNASVDVIIPWTVITQTLTPPAPHLWDAVLLSFVLIIADSSLETTYSVIWCQCCSNPSSLCVLMSLYCLLWRHHNTLSLIWL